jgi:hypothetical protein
MLLKVVSGIAVVVALFLGYVSTRPSHFRWERSGDINAPPEKIYPYLTQFKLGSQWSPYEKDDPNMKKSYSGADGTVGSAMDFESKTSGAGRLEILEMLPNQSVKIRLLMTKPMAADHLVEYQLSSNGASTHFTWVFSGEFGFLGKLVSVFIDCEKMTTDQIDKGINNLKTLIESQK